MTEQRALALVRQRRQEGLSYFIDRYTAYVGAVAWRVLAGRMSRQDAEEVVADVFLVLWEKADALRTANIKGWLGAAARNGALNRLRRQTEAHPVEEDILETPGDGPEALLEHRERRMAVRRAVEAMGPPDREIFVRYYYYCQTAADIAAALGMTPAAVRQRLKRGRERLREELMKGELADDILYN